MEKIAIVVAALVMIVPNQSLAYSLCTRGSSDETTCLLREIEDHLMFIRKTMEKENQRKEGDDTKRWIQELECDNYKRLGVNRPECVDIK